MPSGSASNPSSVSRCGPFPRTDDPCSRRDFGRLALGAGLALAWGQWKAQSGEPKPRRVRTGIIRCGSVSHAYLPILVGSRLIELVSLCDIRPERARRQAERFNVPHVSADLESMLAGEPFEFLVNLTDMQAHEAINRRALEAGKHVWSEKPLANSLAAGQKLLRLAREQGRRLWAAPITVQSPRFAFMARVLREGRLGRVAAAHASYGHEGPTWSAFFYEKLGGSLPDLAVYNLTTVAGLLGPVRSVMAMLSILTPERIVEDKGRIRVEAEDNAMLLLDHGQGVLSHVQSGFNYFNPHGHEGRGETRHTLWVVGTQGYMGLAGYDWEPLGVDLATREQPELRRHATDAQGYRWQQGAALAAECLATGRDLLVTAEHALHVLEIITAARESAATGRRVELTSTFRWPLLS
jgi:predicted dehydrogenase